LQGGACNHGHDSCIPKPKIHYKLSTASAPTSAIPIQTFRLAPTLGAALFPDALGVAEPEGLVLVAVVGAVVPLAAVVVPELVKTTVVVEGVAGLLEPPPLREVA
jgi:hypothetical protein